MASARQLLLDILLRDKTGPGSKSAADNVHTIGDAAADAAKETEKLGKETDRADDKVDRFGKSSRTAAEHVERLDREIESCERELRQLAVAFAEADVAADRLDLSKAIRRTQSDLKKLNTSKGLVSKLLPSAAETSQAGQDFAHQLMSSVGASLATGAKGLANPVGAALGAGIGIAAAPPLAAALSSALSGGAGAGVIGVGILAAVKGDTAIQAAGKAAGERFMSGLEDEAKVLRGPVLESLNILAAAGDRINKKLGATFAELSDDVVPFVRDIVAAGEAITDSLLDAAGKSGPALRGLGDAVKLVSDGVSRFIDEVSDGGPAAADNIRVIAGAVGELLAITGAWINTLDKLSSLPGAGGPLDILRKHFHDVSEETAVADAAAKTLDATQKKLSGSMGETSAAARDQVDALTELSNQLKGETDPVFGMLRAQDGLRAAQKGVNAAIKEHGRNSPEYQEALRKQAEAALGLEAAAGKVASTSSGKLGPALRNTLREAGFTEAEIRNLEGQFKNAKRAGDAFAKNYSAHATLTGPSSESEARLKRVKNLLDAMHSKKISATVVVNEAKLNALAHQLPGAFRAEGGPVKAGHGYIVGEKRPEVFVPDRDGTIIPSVSKFTGGSMAGRPAGGAGGTLTVDVRGADSEMARLLLRILKYQPAVRAEVKRLVA